MTEVVKRWEKFADGRAVCYWYRDRAGFCWLWPLCGKRCPKTQEAADRAMEKLKQAMIDARDKDSKT